MESIKCPCCNASLMYDLEDKELKCNFCGTLCKIEEEKTTDVEFLEKRFMTAHKTSCPECGAKLMTDINTVSSRCTYCGNSLVYSEKIDKAFKPKKILLFEIGIDEVREKVKKYFTKSAFEYKDNILNALEPIYLPYWMYDCICEAEYDYYFTGKHRKKHYLATAKLECEGILADASIKIEDKLSDQLDKYFDLSKLRDFSTEHINGFWAEEYDVTFKSVYDRLNKKLESEVIEKELGFPIVADKKIEVSKIRSTYIQLPFYYAEVNGLKILVNGQTGDITINSKEYLKNQKRMVFLGVILIFAAMGIYLYGREILLHVLGFLLSWSYVLIVLVPIGIELYLTFRKKKQRYIRKIIYKKQKELSVWEEIERARVIPQKQNSIDSTDSKGCSIIVSAMMGIWFLIMVIFVIKIVMQ